MSEGTNVRYSTFMSDDNNCQPLVFMQFFQNIHHFHGCFAVQGSGRFIGKDDLRFGYQGIPDRTDRVYLNADSCSVIHDDALNRTIDVVHHHQHNVVAWNPGPALSVSMGDMPDDGYKTFVCVETCCVTQPQKASEETPSRLAQTISVKKR